MVFLQEILITPLHFIFGVCLELEECVQDNSPFKFGLGEFVLFLSKDM